MKVVFVHQDGKLTGSAFSMLNLIRGFEGRISVHVVLAESGPYQDLLRNEGIPCSICSFTRFWTFPGPKWYHKAAYTQLQALRKKESIRHHILKLKPDLIHINDKAALQVGISLRDTGIPIVQHLRSSYFVTNTLVNKLTSIMCISSYSNSLIAISEDELDGFNNDPRLEIIFNTVNLEASEQAILNKTIKREELGIQEDEIAIGYAANLSKMKGAWDFLEMADRLLQQFPEKKLRFVMAGNTPKAKDSIGLMQKLQISKMENPAKKINKYLSRNRLKHKVNILGFRRDILEIIAAMDILVVCTRLGVMGRQPFEAMSVCTPPVVTAGHSGKSSIVINEKTGLVVPMKNRNALVNAVSRLVENQNLRNILAKNGYKFAHLQFNPVVNAKKVLKIYQRLTGIQINY